MIQKGTNIDLLSEFQEGCCKLFNGFLRFWGCAGKLFIGPVSEETHFLAKNADPRFLQTVKRFDLIFEVLGLPKYRENFDKGLLEIIVS